MFKKLIEETSASQRMVSPGQASPFRTRKAEPFISPKAYTNKSPIRSQPQDIGLLKNYLDNNLFKVKTATPRRSRSPIADNEYKQPGLYRKTSQLQQRCYSPIKARPFNDVFKQPPPPSTFYYREESSRTYYTEVEKENKKQNAGQKQNIQLFRQLIDQIKLNGEFSKQNSQAEPAPVPAQAKSIKPELNQFTELLKHKSSESKKTIAPLQRMLSQPTPSQQTTEREESMLISNKKSLVEPYVEPVKDTVTQTAAQSVPPLESQQGVNFSLGMQSKVKMVESAKPTPLIIVNQSIRRSGDSMTLLDMVNESQEVDFSGMEDRLNMDPCL